jgi:hypothetical protein
MMSGSSFGITSRLVSLVGFMAAVTVFLLVIDNTVRNRNNDISDNSPALPDQQTPPSLGGSSVIRSPADVQELVNRGVAVVIGTVSKEPAFTREGPFDESGKVTDHHTIPFSTYEIEIERVIVDDGAVPGAPLLRLSGTPQQIRFPMGERLLFVLDVNPDGRYGVNGDWAIVRLSGDTPRNYGGSVSSYMEGRSTDSLIAEVEAAARNHKHIPVSEWPRIEYE